VTLSSAILYLAIVAIWAVVLVPRWLRPSRTSGTLESNLAEPVEASPQGDLADAGVDEVDEEGEEDSPAGSPEADSGQAERGSRVPPRLQQEQEAGPAGPAEAGRRARILQARRRTLTTLIVLTAGAVAIAMTHLAAWWVTIPPLVMLAGFVLLLREAARTDAGHVRAAASRRRHGVGDRVRAEADTGTAAGDEEHAGPADDSQAGPPSAEIIDISARVGDQLYDQYADAEVRAVGD
jgi:hypothetical protein